MVWTWLTINTITNTMRCVTMCVTVCVYALNEAASISHPHRRHYVKYRPTSSRSISKKTKQKQENTPRGWHGLYISADVYFYSYSGFYDDQKWDPTRDTNVTTVRHCLPLKLASKTTNSPHKLPHCSRLCQQSLTTK